MKNRMIAAFAFLAFAAGTTGMANAQTAPRVRPATLTVTGSSSITRAPDRATVSFRIETANDQSAAATSANNAIVSTLNARLSALHIPSSNISTSSYALNYIPRPAKPDPASTQRFGYIVERTIDVVTDSVDGAGTIVDAGVAAGVTNVNGISFSLRDAHAALRSAQTAALADGVAQAKDLAAAAGVKIVRILAISPSGGGSPVRPVARMMLAAAAAPTTIDPGNLTVDASVTIAYEIAPLRP